MTVRIAWRAPGQDGFAARNGNQV